MSDDNAVDGDNGSTVSRRNTLRTVGATSAGIVGLQTGVIGASASSSDECPLCIPTTSLANQILCG